MSKIVCVVPSIRPEKMEEFRAAWGHLFAKHQVVLVVVWDGEEPRIEFFEHSMLKDNKGFGPALGMGYIQPYPEYKDLVCRFTDGVRNLGLIVAAKLGADYILTLDDDVEPVRRFGSSFPNDYERDPIQDHLDVLSKRVPISWMNTAHDTNLYLRGFPYGIRDEVPVMLSHGVWVGVPDFDGETQLKLEEASFKEEQKYNYDNTPRVGSVPHSLPYYVGPVPRGVLFPMCGMSVMIRKEALPYFYFAPMGPDTGISIDNICVCPKCEGVGCKECCNGSVNKPDTLHRFADIWCGIFLKRAFDELGWACYTGGAVVNHTRASDARKNLEQERLVREWNEVLWKITVDELLVPRQATLYDYWKSYAEKRVRFDSLIRKIQGNGK